MTRAVTSAKLATEERDLRQDTVFLGRTEARYGATARGEAPELPADVPLTSSLLTLRHLFRDAGLDAARFGTTAWSPLAALDVPGKRVLVKPNWVLHENLAGNGLDCLITHTEVLEAVVHLAALARPASIIIGDAPIQGCDFAALERLAGFERLRIAGRRLGVPVEIRDFRLVVRPGGSLTGESLATARAAADYVLFDLGVESALEPISADAGRFRVTMYDPRELAERHGPKRHQYLVAREVIDADVVINAPKLKTHCKAGITGALKNFVGINGHKSYLPHHRKGGSRDGGDCYPGTSSIKGFAEDMLDTSNQHDLRSARMLFGTLARGARAAAVLVGADRNLEGAWFGNDTVWRTTLDLNQIVMRGTRDGDLVSSPQRTILSITDAIIAGEGNGPLGPSPVPLGLLTLAFNTAVAELVHCLLMGFDPELVPVVREAFRANPRQLSPIPASAVRCMVDGAPAELGEARALVGRAFAAPPGWAGHCEVGAGSR